MNRFKSLIIMASVLFAAGCCSDSCENKGGTDTPIISKHENIVVKDGIMTPEIMWSLGRVGETTLSPDGQKVVYGVTYYDIAENKGNTELYMMNVDGSNKKQLTKTAGGEYNPVFINEGNTIAFISGGQIWKMDLDGGNIKQLSNYDGDISAFKVSPDGAKILFIADVKVGQVVTDIYPDLPKANAHFTDNLMYKHWDEWVSTAPHPFVADFNGSELANITDILAGLPYESPMRPWGGIEQLDWSKDSKTVAYTCRKKTGKEYSISTNSDIYLYSLADKSTRNISEGMMGYDQNPVFSNDGRMIAWQSMERDGYEADKVRLIVMELETGNRKDLTVSFDQNAEQLVWSADDKDIYFVSCIKGTHQIYKTNLETLNFTPITEGVHDYTGFKLVNDVMIATQMSYSKPVEIYNVDIKTGKATEISFENKHILDQIKMGKVEEKWIKTTDGKDMLTWVIYPVNFDPNKQYPALLFCQGGPQSAVSQFFSYRWNFQLMAANDYIVIAPNRRGLPGFGQEWNEQISGDYGGQNMKDYLSAVDYMVKEPYVDANRVGCAGASYGGFSVYWLAGHHNKRFKAFLAHSGMFNLESQYLETEEQWFVNWDLGGAYWDKTNKIAQNSYANSPHLFVEKWDTPIMCVHGEKDYRILASQSMSAFNAAVLRGIPAELLVFPDENHWILKPQNSILWHRSYFKWFDKWLK